MPTHLLLSLFQALDLEWWWREPQRKILRYETFPPHLNYKITSNKLKGFEENSGPTYGFRSLLDSSQIAFYLLMKQKKYITLLIHTKYFALSDWPLAITWLILHHQLALTIFGRTDVSNGIYYCHLDGSCLLLIWGVPYLFNLTPQHLFKAAFTWNPFFLNHWQQLL